MMTNDLIKAIKSYMDEGQDRFQESGTLIILPNFQPLSVQSCRSL